MSAQKPSEDKLRSGQPRSDQDAAFLTRFEKRIRLPLIVSAILPLVVVPETGGWVSITVNVICWLVFLVDYVVHVRHVHRYRRTALGRFDLIVVVATAPWFLIPGAQPGRFAVALRLGRLARLVVTSRGSRVLFERLGRVAIVAVGVTIVASLVAYHAEHPTNSEFATVGDALWWGIVTLTTVGYGDIVPKTPTGRWAAVTIMLTGIAVLGTLAGSLSSFFRLDTGAAIADPGQQEDPARQEPDVAAATAPVDLRALTGEVTALREEIAVLRTLLAGQRGTQPGPAGGGP